MALGRQYPLIDRILDGQLEQRLREARRDGKSFFSISNELARDGITVTPQTVKNWCDALGIKPEDAA